MSARPADHERRMRAAETRAQWELGDAAWAQRILAAYWEPDEDAAALRAEKAAMDAPATVQIPDMNR